MSSVDNIQPLEIGMVNKGYERMEEENINGEQAK
jgi:hypothetical protein